MNKIDIVIVGKDIGVPEAYSKVEKALEETSSFKNVKININYLDSHLINSDNFNELLKGYNGILVPGGFNSDGVDGMILAIKYARENNTPFFGICLGMQLTVIEFARNMAGLSLATSSEFDSDSSYKVIDRIPDLKEKLREGIFKCALKEGSLIEKCYQSTTVNETFRHGYNVNNQYRELLENKGLIISATSNNKQFVEAVELKNHSFFLGVQFHPEYSAFNNKPHPLFLGFIEAAFENRKE